MGQETALAKSNTNTSFTRYTPEDISNQVQLIQQVMRSNMKADEHYGIIPGTTKNTLLKPGAEKLGLLFRLAPEYTVDKELLPNNHREYEVTCTVKHIDTGATWGQGVGICSTMESKFRYRNAAKKCPACGGEFIIKGKAEYGGGWLCFKKNGGCGAKFNDGDKSIEDQPTGKIENPDIADVYNTVKKMAKKRAFVDAMITATSASDIFTQDLEDIEANKKAANGQAEEVSYTEVKEEPKKNTPKANVQQIDPLLNEIVNTNTYEALLALKSKLPKTDNKRYYEAMSAQVVKIFDEHIDFIESGCSEMILKSFEDILDKLPQQPQNKAEFRDKYISKYNEKLQECGFDREYTSLPF